jgi:hypothetical protein
MTQESDYGGWGNPQYTEVVSTFDKHVKSLALSRSKHPCRQSKAALKLNALFGGFYANRTHKTDRRASS